MASLDDLKVLWPKSPTAPKTVFATVTSVSSDALGVTVDGATAPISATKGVNAEVGDRLLCLITERGSLIAISRLPASEAPPTKSYVDAQDASILAGAKSYADTKDATTLSSAKSYADGLVQEDTGWVSPTFASGWSSSFMQFRKVGNVVYTRRYFAATDNVAANTWHEAGVLGVAFRPEFAIYIPIICGASGGASGAILIATSGIVSVIHFYQNPINFFRGGFSYHI